jgi:hypothetical protein
MQACKQPDQALKCAALLAAAFLAAEEGRIHIEVLLNAATAEIALRLFPHTLSALLRRPSWQQVLPLLLLPPPPIPFKKIRKSSYF